MLRLAALLFATLLVSGSARAADPDPFDWPAVLAAARGQTVYWNAWGGDPVINAYIGWAAGEMAARFGVTVEHVKLADTADAVARIVAEKASGREDDGSVDLIWINGENFVSLKKQGLLFGPWAEALPNFALADVTGKPVLTSDFTEPVEGYESPWGLAQLVFMHDTATVPDPPRSMAALADWAADNPGRFAYPQPPDFLGATFLKQALYEVAPDRAALLRPADDAAFRAATDLLWPLLDRLRPHLWRRGEAYPPTGTALRTLLGEGEIDIAFTFNPGAASTAIAQGELPDTVRTYVLDGGVIGNAHFVAIPFNARAKAGAMVLADFLLSPGAQARKADPRVWGDPTVLDVGALADADRTLFEALPLGVATLSPEDLGPSLPEPHASWLERLEAAWTARYAAR